MKTFPACLLYMFNIFAEDKHLSCLYEKPLFQKETSHGSDYLATKLALLRISSSLHPDQQRFKEKKELLKKVTKLPDQMVTGVSTPFFTTESAAKLNLIESNQKELKQTVYCS